MSRIRPTGNPAFIANESGDVESGVGGRGAILLCANRGAGHRDGYWARSCLERAGTILSSQRRNIGCRNQRRQLLLQLNLSVSSSRVRKCRSA